MNGYIAIYKCKKIEVLADSIYQAQQKAQSIFKCKKGYDINIMLAEVDHKQVIHSTASI